MRRPNIQAWQRCFSPMFNLLPYLHSQFRFYPTTINNQCRHQRTYRPRVTWWRRQAWPNQQPICSSIVDDMELAIQKFAVLNLLVMGLSHIFQHRAWAELFIHWRAKGEVGVFYAAILPFIFGTL